MRRTRSRAFGKGSATMTEPRTTARRVLDEEAAAAAGQTPGETAALKRYGATGGVRSAEWIQKNLGAAGLTSRELASRYYVPGVKDTEAGGEVSRGRTGVTLAQVMALPKGDLDRAAAMGALTAAELDTRRYARMIVGVPKEIDRSSNAIATAGKLLTGIPRGMTADDYRLYADYTTNVAASEAKTQRQTRADNMRASVKAGSVAKPSGPLSTREDVTERAFARETPGEAAEEGIYFKPSGRYGQPAAEEGVYFKPSSRYGQPAAATRGGTSVAVIRPVPREEWGSYRKMDFGLRADGKTRKGMGFFGPIDVGGGNIATELSVRMKGPDGKLVHIPSLVPTLTGGELKGLLTDFDRTYTPEVERKVKAFAASRISRGLSPFAGPDEIVPFPDFDKAAKAETLARRTTLLF